MDLSLLARKAPRPFFGVIVLTKLSAIILASESSACFDSGPSRGLAPDRSNALRSVGNRAFAPTLESYLKH
jgi:hypothetical protein